MAVVQPDTALRRDSKSAFWYGSAPSWRVLTKISAVGSRAHHPQLFADRDVSTLSWEAFVREGDGTRREARTVTSTFGEMGAANEGAPTTIYSRVYGFPKLQQSPCQLDFRSPRMVNAMPPSIAVAAMNSRAESCSPRKIIPPAAARTGTLSCTVAALLALSPCRAVYQITYPNPEASTPDETA